MRGEIEQLKKHVAALDANLIRLHAWLDPLEAGVSTWAASTATLADLRRSPPAL